MQQDFLSKSFTSKFRFWLETQNPLVLSIVVVRPSKYLVQTDITVYFCFSNSGMNSFQWSLQFHEQKFPYTECICQNQISLVDLKAPLCVFLIVGPKRNAGSVLIPVFDTAFYALSHGSKHFVLYGSCKNRLFQRLWWAVEEFWPIRKWLKKVPWRKVYYYKL